MTKPELGAKHLCARCGARFYDLNRAPIACPKCGTVFEAAQVSSRWRAEAVRAPVRQVGPVAGETLEPQSVSPEDADTEAEQGPDEAPDAEDEVEADEDGFDDGALIEESEEEDTDVTEIIGDDIDVKEGD
jgi:uncharacterized protein (TIGR02300 family)